MRAGHAMMLFLIAACVPDVEDFIDDAFTPKVEEPANDVVASGLRAIRLAKTGPDELVACMGPAGAGIYRITLPDRQVSQIAGAECSGIAFSADEIAWTLYQGGYGLGRYDRHTGNIDILSDYAAPAPTSDPVINEEDVYWASPRDGRIYVDSVRPGGERDRRSLADNQDDPHSLAVDATHVYWAVWGQGGSLRRVGKTGGAVEDLVSGRSYPRRLRLAGGFVYWLEGQQNGAVMRTRTTGGAIERIATSNDPFDLAYDDEFLYWTEYDRVVRMAIAGGAVQVVASGQSDATAIVVDDCCVYWGSSNKVIRKPKSEIK